MILQDNYVNFNWTGFFLYPSLFSITWPSNLGVPPLANEFCLYEERTSSPVRGLFCNLWARPAPEKGSTEWRGSFWL